MGQDGVTALPRNIGSPISDPAQGPTFGELFLPKIVTVFREGYGLNDLRRDALAGLTVAIVALPLSMAIGIASGASPAQGLYAAIIGGFIVSVLGGSRFQIGGPAGAFIVLVSSTVAMHGIDGLLLATCLSGLMLIVLGLARLGSYVKLVPYPVVIGFTAGIALIILMSQVTALTGMRLDGPEPGPMLEKLPALWVALPSAEIPALMISGGSVFAILIFRRFLPSWPGMLIVVAMVSLISALFQLPVETIGSRFGAFPAGLPMPEIPELSAGKIMAVLPNAIAFTLLGAIESLLSAVVADSMTGRRHRANCELVAQGLANIGSSLFGGICVTGTIARTATNVRAGARGPLAGMFHAVYLLLFILFAAPLVSFVPLAALASVLVVVAWNMVEKHAMAALLKSSPADAAVLLATLGLTVFWGLAEAIVVGIALGSLAFIHRMAKSAAIEAHQPFMAGDLADDDPRGRMPVDALPRDDHGAAIYRISGVFFFGAAAAIGAVLERVAERCPALVIDLSAVPLVDSTAAHAIEGLAHKIGQRGGSVFVTGASPAVRRLLRKHAVKPPLVRFSATPEAALQRLRELPTPD